MSGVYIKGLNIDEMYFCPFQDTECGYCLISKDEEGLLKHCERIDKCPYEVVPDHGRLVDADALKVHHGIDVGANHGGLRAVVFKKDIDNAPTIIEEDRSE